MRWLCLPSENGGQDWFSKSREIDQAGAVQGLELDSEQTFLLYSEGSEHCLIARPVIGPKLTVAAPFMLIDWKAAPIWEEKLQGETLEDFLAQIPDLREKASKGPKPLSKSFTLRVTRELLPELKLSVEAIFHE